DHRRRGARAVLTPGSRPVATADPRDWHDLLWHLSVALSAVPVARRQLDRREWHPTAFAATRGDATDQRRIVLRHRAAGAPATRSELARAAARAGRRRRSGRGA